MKKKKQVKCDSGVVGWQCHLQENYSSLEEFQAYDDVYDISGRLGFEGSEEAWIANPLIQGSVNPSDLKIVKL